MPVNVALNLNKSLLLESQRKLPFELKEAVKLSSSRNDESEN